ncbi:DoxX family protein [Acidicapsa dinghuensis]|uniref:DoxX family protein n=1 Tax=Acidicapsa dinghuensis TaxID=2218256 RepID=A0ABW1EJ54_9BACT|nr:DoxX family protein [Acidicapsa dinghuensis]
MAIQNSTSGLGLFLVRLLVGGVFLTEGIQKFLFPAALGAGRFAKIGIPAPQYTARFVGGVEVLFGGLLILGLFTTLSAIPLLIDISVALYITKWPMLHKEGIWPTMHESRVDLCMFLGLLAILLLGPGGLSFDRFRRRSLR